MSDDTVDKDRSGTTDDITRRQWLLRLGEMVALAGVSGLVPETAVALLGTQESTRPITSLPPGLYDPSNEHLVHAIATAKFVPPPGSETDFVQLNPGPFQPQFFSPEEFRVVTRFVEIVLGKVDPVALAQATQWLDLWLRSAVAVREAALHLDPMHQVLAVAYYGEEEVRALETSDPQAVARSGLKALDDLSIQKHGKAFMDLTDSDQVELIASTGSALPDTHSRRFFDLMRGEAIRGYYTSAKGLEELDYQGNAFYAECPGCEPKS